MPLNVTIEYALGRSRAETLGRAPGNQKQVIGVSYDGTITGFDYDYELAFLALGGYAPDARFEFVEVFAEEGFHGILDIGGFRAPFLAALVDQGIPAFVEHADLTRRDEMDLLVAILWYLGQYNESQAEEAAKWILPRMDKIRDPEHDHAEIEVEVHDAYNDEPFTNTVKVDYAFAINGMKIGEFSSYAGKHAYDPVEVETAFEVEDIDYAPSYVWKLIDMFGIDVPEGVKADDILDPVVLSESPDGEFLVIYTDAEDEVSIDSAVKVRRFRTRQNAIDAMETFKYMSENLDSMDIGEHKVTLAKLRRELPAGAEINPEDVTLIETWYYKPREGRYFGEWKSSDHDADGREIPQEPDDV